MFYLELHQQRVAELHRRAEQDRLAREALGARRAARRAAARRTPEAEPHTHGPRRHWFTPTA